MYPLTFHLEPQGKFAPCPMAFTEIHEVWTGFNISQGSTILPHQLSYDHLKLPSWSWQMHTHGIHGLAKTACRMAGGFKRPKNMKKVHRSPANGCQCPDERSLDGQQQYSIIFKPCLLWVLCWIVEPTETKRDENNYRQTRPWPVGPFLPAWM